VLEGDGMVHTNGDIAGNKFKCLLDTGANSIDDGIRYRITSVMNKNKTYICRVVELNNPKIWRLFTLYDVLVEGKKETWYKKDFDVLVERLNKNIE
jgi:hypothetical protein